MFLKQYNYKPRSNSGSSGSDSSSAVDTTKTASAGEAAINKAVASGRRRSSATEKFAGLQGYKRNSQDQAATDHRASLAEQKPGAGVLGNMWQNFTKGS